MPSFLPADKWTDRWVISDWKKSEGAAGEWEHTAGKFHKDPEDKGKWFSAALHFVPSSSTLPSSSVYASL